MTAPLILVVDNDDDLREFLEMVLETAGYRVAHAVNGVEALEAVRAERPALILLDMRMPVMDGWAFCEAIRAEYTSPPPIAVMTAAADPARRAAEVQADAWLSKPWAHGDLLRLLRRFTTNENNELRHST